MILNLRNWLYFIALIASVSLFSSCHDLKVRVDLIIFNAKIYTPDSTSAEVNCIAVKNGRIFKMGTDNAIRSRYWAEHYINASGKYIYPGFIDAHCHFFGLAQSMQWADLSTAQSLDDMINMLKKFRSEHPQGWLTGRGWDQNKWNSKAFPDNKILNEAFPGIPVVLTRVDGHAVLASEAAIEASGIKLPAKKGEALISNGKFTGIFLEETADKIKNAVPKLSNTDMTLWLEKAEKICHEAGLTGLSDAGLEKPQVLLLDSLQKAGKIKLRIDAWLSPTDENFEYFVRKGVYQTPFLRVGAIKLYADGALGSRGAFLLKPYTDDPKNSGLQQISRKRLIEICQLAYNYGYQVNTHAIGDAAVRMVLEAYGEVLKSQNHRRWRIEHSQVVDANDFALFGKYSIIPSVQATHATSDMAWAGLRIGPQRVKNAYAYQQLLQQNGWLPNGTDFPVESIEPLHTFYAATARKSLDNQPEGGFQPENALTRMQALKSMTQWAAMASFADNERGGISVGKLADFTILDQDIIKTNDTKLLKTKVLYTIVNGEIVYNSKNK